MNFFDRQEYLKNQTQRLYLLYFLTILVFIFIVNIVVLKITLPILILVNVKTSMSLYVYLSLGIALFLILNAFLKYAELKKDGSIIAKLMGGIALQADTQDFPRLTLKNIVEELAIASGIPAPKIYILESELSINAFVSGTKISNTALTVTRGAIMNLDRVELQGLVAHEFSHIRNGDILINIKIMALFNGMLLILKSAKKMMKLFFQEPSLSTFIFFCFATGYGLTLGHKHFIPNADGSYGSVIFGAHVVIAFGLFLFIFGSLGLLLSRLVKAQISQTREYLADASAIEFTRQPNGLKQALLKIEIHEYDSYLFCDRSEDVSHMLFASGSYHRLKSLNTHPDLSERIIKIDPNYNNSELRELSIAVSIATIKKSEENK